MANPWTIRDIPDLRGKTAIVTGANSGLGFHTAEALAAKGARVIMACRNLEKAEEAAARVRAKVPGADLEVRALDLGSLASIHAFAEAFEREHPALHLLINNAGIMMCPFGKTADGFETQFGTNHLGHFALTGLLLGVLAKTPGARIVNVSSLAHLGGKIDFDNLNGERSYNRTRAYNQSKLANLLFTLELQRRLERVGAGAIAVAAHPGWSATNLQAHAALFRAMNPLVAQSAEMGALPTLRAATAPDVRGGEYYGPGRLFEMNGPPKRARRSPRARDASVAERLWQVSEKMTGVRY